MNRHLLGHLSEAQDFSELARALVAECEPYGRIHSLHLTHNKRAGRVSCVIEMDSMKQQIALKRALGATGQDGSAYLEIPVGEDFALAEPAAAYPADLQPAYLSDGRASPLTA
jgi:hypothetical protein